jgi:hypothetical protein
MRTIDQDKNQVNAGMRARKYREIERDRNNERSLKLQRVPRINQRSQTF